MAKKQEEKMKEEKKYFVYGKTDDAGNIEIPGCVRNGINETTAIDIFDSMVSFAQYAFNKSHATAYAVITYQTAWLKRYYPSEFLAASMSSLMDKPDHLLAFMQDAVKIVNPMTGRKIKILPPSVFRSNSHFSVENGDIRYGLNAIKGVGTPVAEDIEAKRKSGADFSNLYSFLNSLEVKNINSKAIESLILSGALNGVVPNIASGYLVFEDAIKRIRDKKKKENTDQMTIFGLLGDEVRPSYPKIPVTGEYPANTLLSMEKKLTGLYLSGHPLQKYEKVIQKYVDLTAREMEDPEIRMKVLVKKYGKFAINAQRNLIMAGIITECRTRFTKDGKKKIAFLTVEDMEGNAFQVDVFSKEYLEFSSELEEENLIAVRGSVDARNGDALIAKDIVRLADIKSLAARIPGRLTIEEQKEQKDRESRKPDKIVKIVCREDDVRKIRGIAKSSPGKAPVVLYSVRNKQNGIYAGFSIDSRDAVIARIEALVGKNNVKVQNMRKPAQNAR